MTGRSVLVVTLPPYEGGVPAKTRILCDLLAAQGHRVTVAWYATFAHQSHLNVPAWLTLTGKRPHMGEETAFSTYAGQAVGCWLPELEAPYYRLSKRWQSLIDRHDRHIAVGGPPMVGNILARAGVPHFLWCASDVMADRHDRQNKMAWPRAVVDALVTRPWLEAQQRFILAHTPLVLGVSRYTLKQLRQAGAQAEKLAHLPIPVDPQRFSPPQRSPRSDVVGFAGRFEDPRKDLPLLLEAMSLLRRQRPNARLRLAGCLPSEHTLRRVRDGGLTQAVDFVGMVADNDLADFYRSLDVFALPSHQEGLCLAALEAMACGVPVVSTDCGGPADFVRDDANGFLLPDRKPETMAAALERALQKRDHLGAGARHLVATEFSPTSFARGIAAAWQQVWKEAP